jgi:hypothetical protein
LDKKEWKNIQRQQTGSVIPVVLFAFLVLHQVTMNAFSSLNLNFLFTPQLLFMQINGIGERKSG